ncbi:MAG: phenylalanine--tRNA ligase beta subunit-related protein [Chloroflexi bacterium]|nr:phenylalanine--tRNA ligase beta subunit-related protein [Chloroflexota bacterium]
MLLVATHSDFHYRKDSGCSQYRNPGIPITPGLQPVSWPCPVSVGGNQPYITPMASDLPLLQAKNELEEELRSRLRGSDRAALANLAEIKAYSSFFKRFGKTYHVLLQLESVALKGRPIPTINPLVQAMFMAELKNLLLTAGHDLDVVVPPVVLNSANGDERFVTIRGEEKTLKSGDMMMADADGVISSVIYGPDSRTQITPDTKRVLYAVYGAEGIGEHEVLSHLKDIEGYVRLVSPNAKTEALETYTAGR